MNKQEAVDYLNSLPAEMFDFVKQGPPWKPSYALKIEYGSQETGERIKEALEGLDIPVERNNPERPLSVEIPKTDNAALLIEGVSSFFLAAIKGINEDFTLLMRNHEQLEILKNAGVQSGRIPEGFLSPARSDTKFLGGTRFPEGRER